MNQRDRGTYGPRLKTTPSTKRNLKNPPTRPDSRKKRAPKQHIQVKNPRPHATIKTHCTPPHVHHEAGTLIPTYRIANQKLAGPVGYAQCSERILTYSSSMGIKFARLYEGVFIFQGEVFVYVLTPLDVFWRLSEEPLLLLMSVVSVITLTLLVRVFLKGGGTSGRDVAKPLETIADDEEQTLPEETIATPEIRPVIIDGEVDMATQVHLETAEVSAEIRPLLSPEKPDECEYCSIFKDLGTVVCPNCGRPLNLPCRNEK